ncbi:uncharacterized protein PAE49_021546 [Odontesthes bonariensis]|uniref:uncharacterized protein LOC142369131 n=1 Tax=Odontesthes bonariensis TaxID=219752 RepID=UPI003F581E24
MSHPFYTSLASGKQSFHRGNYGPFSGQMQRDPHGPCPDLVPGSSFSLYGASSTSSTNLGGAIPQQLVLPMQDKSVGHTESNQPNYTPESAANILQSFGLEKEDLEDLLSYPEDQVTPDNLPFILRQFRVHKARGATTAVQSVLQSDEIGRTSRADSCGSGGMLEWGAYSANSFRREPMQKSTAPDQLGSEVSRSLPVKEAEPDCLLTSKTQPSCTVVHGVWAECPGLVPIGSNDHTCNEGESKTRGKRSKKMSKQPTKQLHTQQKAKRNTLLKHGEQQQKTSASQKRKSLRPQVLSAANPASPPSLIPTTVDVPAVSPNVMKTTHVPPAGRQLPAKVAVSKGLPTLANIHDYAAAAPRVFPHTCSLCNKRCALMKVWLSHQNTNLHLDNCRLLRKKHPEWDGEVRQFLSALGKNAKTSSSTRARTSRRGHQKTKHESRSGSRSPRRRSLEGRRHKAHSRSCSRSPLRHCSWDESPSSSRPRSHSPRCRRGSSDRREKRSSRSPHSSGRAHRTQSRSLSPWYGRPSSSRSRARSTSRERQLSSGRRDERRSSPRGSCERRSSPSRSDKEKSPLRRGSEKLSSIGESLSQRKRLNRVKRLVKRVVQTPAVQSLLLAELAKMTSTSLPSSSKAAKLESTTKLLKAKKSKAKSTARLKSVVSKKPPPTSSKEQKKTSKKKTTVPSKSTTKAACTRKTKALKSKHQTGAKTKQKSSKQPDKAMPDRNDTASGAVVQKAKYDIPEGSAPPFWLSMTAAPYLLPTAIPSFYVPDYLTVKGMDDIEKAAPRASMFSTIMLTGLPEGDYTFSSIVKLVGPYFPKQNYCPSFHNVIVFTMQRRAFVYFDNWNMCCTFARDSIRNPVLVRDSVVTVHFVLQDTHPGSNEVNLYRHLMKWSNAHVRELESLEERLLCVNITKTSVELVKRVLEVVASIASFVSFLPLANYIYIEMAECSGVTQVVTHQAMRSRFTDTAWMNIRYMRPVQTLKQSSQGSNLIQINPKLDIKIVEQSFSSKSAAISESVTTRPSFTTASDMAPWKNKEKAGTDVPVDSDPSFSGHGIHSSAAAVQTSADFNREEAKTTKNPVAKAAAKTVELEAKVQTSKTDESEDGNQSGNTETCSPEPEMDASFPLRDGFEILDFVVDRTEKEGDDQKLETPDDDKTSSVGSEATEDSVKDEPAATESGANNEEGRLSGVTAERDDSPTGTRGPITKTSDGEAKEESPKKRNRTIQKYETQANNLTPGKYKMIDEGTVEMVPESTDSDESVQLTSTSERSGGGSVEDGTAYEILDGGAPKETTIITVSTRGTDKRAAKRDVLKEKTKDGNPTSPASDSKEQNGEKTTKKEDSDPTKESPPTKKSDVVRDTTGEELLELLDAAEEEVVEDGRLTRQEKSRRERPKRGVKMTRKQTSAEADDTEAAECRVLCLADDQPRADESKSARKSTVSNDDGKMRKRVGSPLNEVEESMCQTVGSLEDDQVPKLMTPTDVSDRGTAGRAEDMIEDEVGRIEEDEKEAATTRGRGRPKKRTRLTPVRRSARGKMVSAKQEEGKESLPSPAPDSTSNRIQPDRDTSAPPGDVQPEMQSTEGEAASQDVEAAAAKHQPQSECPDNQIPNRFAEQEEHVRADLNVDTKQRAELAGPRAKRSHSQSSHASVDFKLPPFDPNRSFGEEFTVRTLGYFCKLCSVFYLIENSAEDLHCCSETHRHNLLKHYKKTAEEQKPSRMSTRSSQRGVLDQFPL